MAGSGSISQRHGSADPVPHQNVMDPEHCSQEGDTPPSSPSPASPTADLEQEEVEKFLKEDTLGIISQVRG
jgi:hypothetical protein